MLTKRFFPLFVRKNREPSTANRPSVTNECYSRRSHWRITAYCTHHCYSAVFASYEEKEKNSFQTFSCSYVHSRGKIICCKGFFVVCLKIGGMVTEGLERWNQSCPILSTRFQWTKPGVQWILVEK